MKPKRTYRPKKSTTDSFRIKIGGSGNIWSIVELRAMLMEAADRIEAAGSSQFWRPKGRRQNA
jgi:hypothetical protein